MRDHQKPLKASAAPSPPEVALLERGADSPSGDIRSELQYLTEGEIASLSAGLEPGAQVVIQRLVSLLEEEAEEEEQE